MVSCTANPGDMMSTPEVITSKARSDGARKMWERRKAKEQRDAMQNTSPPMKAWVYHSEWFALVTVVVGLLLYVHHENTHLTQRLDNHMEAINRRCDESNNRIDDSIKESARRSDELHKEFYDLLKETRKT